LPGHRTGGGFRTALGNRPSPQRRAAGARDRVARGCWPAGRAAGRARRLGRSGALERPGAGVDWSRRALVIVSVNGERRELPHGATVASLASLTSVAPGPRGVAVAVE